METRRYYWLVVMFCIPLTLLGCATNDGIDLSKNIFNNDFVVIRCGSHKDSIAIWSKKEQKVETRHISFHKNSRDFTIGGPSLKGFSRWNRVRSLIFARFDNSMGYFVVEFSPPIRNLFGEQYPVMGCGQMKEECWNRIKAVVQPEISTIERKISELGT